MVVHWPPQNHVIDDLVNVKKSFYLCRNHDLVVQGTQGILSVSMCVSVYLGEQKDRPTIYVETCLTQSDLSSTCA